MVFFGWGRADLISSNGSVWDVKRDKMKQIENGVKQVKKYTENTWKNYPDVDLHVGGYISSGSFVKTLNVDTYYISYYYAGDGVIAYDYEKVTDWEMVGQYAGETLETIVLAGCTYLIIQSGGSLTSVLVPIAAKAAGG